MYFLQQMELKTTGYNIQEVVVLQGNLDRTRLELTFVQLIRRHESLRTSFHMIEGRAVQKVHPYNKINFEIEYNKKFLEMLHGPGGGFSKEPPGRRRPHGMGKVK